jgi:phosphoglucomutase
VQLIESGGKSQSEGLYETPVGFKHIGNQQRRDYFGGEESAGLSIKGHYRKKTAFL